MSMPEILTYMVGTMGAIVTVLIGLLTYQVYKTDMYRPDLNEKNKK
ncbi:MAG: hypothetical protein M3A44_02090 [Gammaproteobacteria bacterium]